MFAILTFSDLGSVVVALLALLIMGNYIVKHDVNFYLLFLHINNWRLFILCCSIPPLLLLIPLFFIPESPSFLYHVSLSWVDTLSFDHFPPIYFTPSPPLSPSLLPSLSSPSLPLLLPPLSLTQWEQKKMFGALMKALKVIARVNKLCPCCVVRFYALEKVGSEA